MAGRPLACQRVVGARGEGLGAVIAIADAQGDAAALLRQRGRYARQGGYGVDIFGQQVARLPARPLVGAAGAHQQEVAAHGADVLYHGVFAPSPMAMSVITEATPITMPSRVSAVRNRLLLRQPKALVNAVASWRSSGASPLARLLASAARGGVRVQWAAVADDLAVFELDLALGVGGDFGIVGNENNGVALAGEVGQQGHHLLAAAAIQGAGGFIGKDNLAAVHQRAGDGYPLLLAAGELAGPVLLALGQAKLAKQLRRPLPALGRLQLGIERGQLHIGAGVYVLEQMVLLKDKTEGVPAQACQLVATHLRHRLAVKPIVATAGLIEAAEDVHEGGFTRAGLAHNRHKFAGVNAQVDVLQHLQHPLPGGSVYSGLAGESALAPTPGLPAVPL